MRRLALIFCILLLLTSGVGAAGGQIDSLKQEVLVEPDGTLSVTSTVQVTFAGGESEFVFPLGTGAELLSASGGTYRVQTPDDVPCAVFSGLNGGTQTFACSYRLPCAVTATNVGQQFQMHPIEKGWAYPIAKLQLQVTFPADITARPAWSSSYYGNVADNYLTVQIADRTVDVSSAAALKDHETLEMTLQFPPASFSPRNTAGTLHTVSLWIFFLLLAAALLYWFFRLRGALLLPEKQQMVGMEATAGELTCQLYGELPDLAALLAHWGNLGYLSLSRNARGRILVHKQMEMGNERRPIERRLFDAIFRYNATCDVQTERFRAVARAASAPMRRSWVRRVYQAGNPFLLRLLGLLAGLSVGLMTFDLWLPSGGIRWVLLPILALLSAFLCRLVQRGLLALPRCRRVLPLLLGAASALLLLLFSAFAGCSGIMLLNLCLQSFCALATLYGGRRTKVGEALVRQQLGLRRYFRTADREALQRIERQDGQYFYRTLPFAELLGVGGAFAKRMASLSEPCAWLTDAQSHPANAPEFYALYREIAAAVRGEAALPTRGAAKVPAAAGKKNR